MAGIEVRNGRYNIILRFGGKRFVRSLKTSDEGVEDLVVFSRAQT